MKKILLFITILFLFAFKVEAEQVVLSRDQIDNVYVYYYDNNLGRERYLEAEKYTLGNNTAYCLEIGKVIESNFYTYTPSFEILGLDDDILDYLLLAAYYGYDYPKHNTYNYYMASQELIWKKKSKIGISWVRDLTPSYVVDVSTEKAEIESLINSHYTLPSFDNTEVTLLLEDLTIEDKNHVLKYFTSTDDKVKIDGDNLIISKDFKGEEITLVKPSYTTKEFLLYTSGISQKMFSVGQVKDITSKLKVKIPTGSVEIHKLDMENGSNIAQGDATLNGAVYELFDENDEVVGTFIIGKKNKIDNLPYGQYILKEKTPSKGYFLDINTYPLTISQDNEDVVLTVYEEVIKRKVDLYKVYATDKTGILVGEEGIDFEIYNSKGESIATITTDETGYATVTLPYGRYTFRQKNSPNNYFKVDDFTIEITEAHERPIYKILANSQLKAKVKVIKKDLATRENITDSKIKFKIYDVTNNKFVSFKVTYPTSQVIDEFQIDSSGIFITPEPLPPGDYILYEVDAPMDNYLYNSEGINFTIDMSSNFINEDGDIILEIPFYNTRVTGKISLSKMGEELSFKDSSYYYKNVPLESVIFKLYAKEDIYINNKLIYREDELVSTLTTDIDGNATIDNLPLGKYYLKEEESVKGHIPGDEIYDINLLYEDQYTSQVEYSLNIQNYLPKSRLIINKYETGTNKPLEHTLIEIRTIDNQIVWKGYTDENGQIIIEDLPYGNYYLSELEATSGHRLLEDNIYFEITDTDKVIDIYNERIKVPNTGLNLNFRFLIPIFLVILSFIILVIFNKNTKIVIICLIISLASLIYLTHLFYIKYTDDYKNQKSVEAFIENKDIEIQEEKYNYKAVLEIPSINLKRGILGIDSTYNDAKYNIELVKEDDNLIVLASHNGNNLNSYFGKLKDMLLGDEINYYTSGRLEKYVYSSSYEIQKDGYADIYRREDKKTIILITCKDNTDDTQIVFVGYLKEIVSY